MSCWACYWCGAYCTLVACCTGSELCCDSGARNSSNQASRLPCHSFPLVTSYSFAKHTLDCLGTACIPLAAGIALLMAILWLLAFHGPEQSQQFPPGVLPTPGLGHLLPVHFRIQKRHT